MRVLLIDKPLPSLSCSLTLSPPFAIIHFPYFSIPLFTHSDTYNTLKHLTTKRPLNSPANGPSMIIPKWLFL